MSTDENHYTELRKRYVTMCQRHGDIVTVAGRDSETARELLNAIREIEDLLNEWNERDDRDGSRDRSDSSGDIEADTEMGDLFRGELE